MAKQTIEVTLPHPFTLPGGEEVTDAVVGLLTIKDRLEMKRRFPSEKHFDERTIWLMEKRLLRLGPIHSPIDREVIMEMPTSDFDYLLEAMWALDSGYESVEDFRDSDEYRQMTTAI